jgi:WhiB family redox-sensing transcriptional regulator
MTQRISTSARTDPPRYDWQDDAACRTASVELFFGPEGERPTVRREREARALAICAQCPVLEACRRHALTLPEIYGVWGGTTEHQRAEWRRTGRAA